MKVRVQRKPVLMRLQGPDGGLARNGYVRTAAAVETREEQLLRISRPSRAVITWGSLASYEVSLRSGRMIGHPDYLVEKSSLKELRKLAREKYPQAPEPAADTGAPEAECQQ